MLILGKLAMGMMGTVLVGGGILCSEGFIHVKVNEKQPNGTHLSLVVPAMLAPMAVRFVPKRDLRDGADQMHQYLPVIHAALSGLRDCPDGTTLVEVVDEDTHATVVKDGGSLIVDVDDPGETVHVAVPLRATERTIEEIAASSGPN